VIFNGLNHHDVMDLIDSVRKPARYFGREINAIQKPFQEVKVHLALVYPDLYEVGMSHLGLKILYSLANSLPGVYAERVFAPALDMEKKLQERNIPLFSLETFTALHRFDLVGFTLQYELTYTTILNMLKLGGIPLRSEERTIGDPFVIGGGPLAVNPEPLAPFFDFIVIGDGEEILPEILEKYKHWDKNGDRNSYLRSLLSIKGLYVPSFYQALYNNGTFTGIKPLLKGAPAVITRRTVGSLEEAHYPKKVPVPYLGIVHDRVPLELFRGCTQGCRFCQAGYIYRPLRERSVSKLKELATALISGTGLEEISLSSLSSSDYSRMEELITELENEFEGKNVRLSLPSLRADPFAMKIADRIQKNKTGGVTFAPEAGTQRLRNVINKRITEEDILGAAAHALETGRNHIKLYFMIGLPTETEEDLLGMVELVKKILELSRSGKRKNRRFSMTVSVSTFVPKTHTPFQWVPQLALQEIRLRQDFLRRRFRKLKGVEFTWHEASMSFLEAVLARGDRLLAPVLERALQLGGKLEASSDQFDYAIWEQAFEEMGINPESYAGFKPDYHAPLPWEHINTGLSKEFLIREYKRAINQQITPDCRLGCVGCGLKDCRNKQVDNDVSL
jgi:radical SAM family uncharacterized protein